ncbi:MAG: zinc metallopeptidase [Ruminococcus sp.]|nr:zinc metallopeptidase [Oscillospiraceae bacterium]MDY4413028.1 zinc metallopeptidase [Ruminococcus sp.]
MSYFLVVISFLVALLASFNVNRTYKKYGQIMSRRGYTADQIARMILDQNGLHNVAVERISGNLTDHFDPNANVVRLSDSVYGKSSVAAIGVAAHECGHAVQYAEQYSPMKIRSAIIPITNIGSSLAYPLVILGIILGGIQPLITIGIWLFIAVVVFQLVTLPVEFNASGRALKTLEQSGYLDEDELGQSKKVLIAAALTYVAALFTAIAQLIRLVAISNRRN